MTNVNPNTPKPILVVLAAGMGSRYGGLKQMDPVGPNGEAVLDYSIYDARRAGFGKVVFVIRRDMAEDFRRLVGDRLAQAIDVDYVFQELDAVPDGCVVPPGRVKPWGTGHAVLVATPAVSSPFAVINADDFYGAESFEVLARTLREDVTASHYAMVAFELGKTLSPHGAVSRGVCSIDDTGHLASVRETKRIQRAGERIVAGDPDQDPETLSVDIPVSMNMWGFATSFFDHLAERFEQFLGCAPDNPDAEFYIPDVVSSLIVEQRATVRVVPTVSEWTGVTYREDRPHVVESLARLVETGAYPSPLWTAR